MSVIRPTHFRGMAWSSPSIAHRASFSAEQLREASRKFVVAHEFAEEALAGIDKGPLSRTLRSSLVFDALKDAATELGYRLEKAE